MFKSLSSKFAQTCFFFDVLKPSDLEKLDVWYDLLTEIFTDPNDILPIETLQEFLRQPDKNIFTLLRDEANKAIGLRLMHVDPDIPGATYIPWGGVSEEVRNYGLYPKLVKRTLEEMKSRDVAYSLHDFEDPARIHVAYSDEPEEVSRNRTLKRLNFFRRALNAVIIDDKDIPYLRPASDDERNIQAYDLLSFSALDYNHEKLSGVFNQDRSAISKAAYRRFYLEITRLQFGNSREEELRERLPAVNEFLTQLAWSPKMWVNIKSGPILPKAKPDLDAVIIDESIRAGLAGVSFPAMA